MSPRGFTLAELFVCTAIAGMAFVFATPALDKGRASADRLRCENNLRMLSQAHWMYANAHAGFAPMALSSNLIEYAQTQPGPGGWYDGHGWYSLVGPYIGEPEWASTIDLSVSLTATQNAAMRRGGLRLKVHACPADIGMQRSEWNNNNWARARSNYVVNAGNTNYGQTNAGTPPRSTPFLGAPFALGRVTALETITDGLSNTLLMSEITLMPLANTTSWPGMYAETQSSFGGQIFTAFNPPNPNSADGIGSGRNGNGAYENPAYMDSLYRAAGHVAVPISLGNTVLTTYISARSWHPGGVNASLCDGSAGFIANTIDPAVWRALSSARGSDFVPATPAPATGTSK